jgi:hypothetical protein
MLDKDKLKPKEATDVLYSGEVPLEVEHFLEVLDKIDKKDKETK